MVPLPLRFAFAQKVGRGSYPPGWTALCGCSPPSKIPLPKNFHKVSVWYVSLEREGERGLSCVSVCVGVYSSRPG